MRQPLNSSAKQPAIGSRATVVESKSIVLGLGSEER